MDYLSFIQSVILFVAGGSEEGNGGVPPRDATRLSSPTFAAVARGRRQMKHTGGHVSASRKQ